MIAFQCPGCKKTHSVGDEFGGRKTKCSTCQTTLIVPMPSKPLVLAPEQTHEVDELEEVLEEVFDVKPIAKQPRKPQNQTPAVPPEENGEPDGTLGIVVRAFVWLGVTIWCFLPFLWLILTAITNQPTRSSTGSSATGSGGTGGNMSLGAAVGFGGGSILFLGLAYGIWCAVGVVCGYGLERAFAVAGEVILAFMETESEPTKKG
jgi:hypothetical protein